ncbi:MAG: hypothetical protein ACREQM_01030 [Candidatus Dormibacteraceae bacterium]
MPPSHGAGVQVVVEQAPQLATVDLRCGVVALGGGEGREHGAMVVPANLGLALMPCQGGERVHQMGVLEGDLAGVGVEVEGAARVAGIDRLVGVVHGRRDAMDLEDPGAQHPARARFHDRDGRGGSDVR